MESELEHLVEELEKYCKATNANEANLHSIMPGGRTFTIGVKIQEEELQYKDYMRRLIENLAAATNCIRWGTIVDHPESSEKTLAEISHKLHEFIHIVHNLEKNV